MIYKKIEKTKEVGACNFCDRAKLSKDRTRLKYPYRKVYVISSNRKMGVSVRFCFKCFKELKELKE